MREGEGGFPLLLLHGWPETMRIWWRNIRPLADAGFEVIVPDLRGFGSPGPAPDGFYDVAAQARDVEALVREELGHRAGGRRGGDLGGVVAQELALRSIGLVDRQVLFNTSRRRCWPTPVRGGGNTQATRRTRRGWPSDYFLRQANDADVVAAELDTRDKRVRYVGEMYGHRFWASPGGVRRGRDAPSWRSRSATTSRSGPRSRSTSRRSASAPVSEQPLWIGASRRRRR